MKIPAIHGDLEIDVNPAPSYRAENPFQGNRVVEKFGVPSDMETTTWWSGNSEGLPAPRPGDPALAVILGHTQIGDYGVFNDLGLLQDGDDIYVSDGSTTLHFRVLGDPLPHLSKTDLTELDAALNNPPPGARLALLTCSGDFNGKESVENTLVYAALVA